MFAEFRCPFLLAAAVCLALLGCRTAGRSAASIDATPTIVPKAVIPADALGAWEPLSHTARAVTGRVNVSTGELTLNAHHYPIEALQPLSAKAAASLNGGFSLMTERPSASVLLRVTVPADDHLLNANTICGGRLATWAALLVGRNAAGRDLGLAVFTGAAAPDFTTAALNNSHDVCGTFSYTAAAK